MDGAVVAAGNEQIAGAIDGQAGGINQRGDERLDAVVGGDLIERNGDALAARAAEGDINISERVDCWIAHGMQVVGDLQADGYADAAGSRDRRWPRARYRR